MQVFDRVVGRASGHAPFEVGQLGARRGGPRGAGKHAFDRGGDGFDITAEPGHRFIDTGFPTTSGIVARGPLGAAALVVGTGLEDGIAEHVFRLENHGVFPGRHDGPPSGGETAGHRHPVGRPGVGVGTGELAPVVVFLASRVQRVTRAIPILDHHQVGLEFLDGAAQARVIDDLVAVPRAAAFVGINADEVLAIAGDEFMIEFVGEIIPFLAVEVFPLRIAAVGTAPTGLGLVLGLQVVTVPRVGVKHDLDTLGLAGGDHLS